MSPKGELIGWELCLMPFCAAYVAECTMWLLDVSSSSVGAANTATDVPKTKQICVNFTSDCIDVS